LLEFNKNKLNNDLRRRIICLVKYVIGYNYDLNMNASETAFLSLKIQTWGLGNNKIASCKYMTADFLN